MIQPDFSISKYLKRGGKEAHKDFDLVDVLGKGSFGSVYKVRASLGCVRVVVVVVTVA